MYKIYLDKWDGFKCKIQLEGATLKNAIPRLILESNNRNLMFYGNINPMGECIIPITDIHNIFKENDTGKIKLEVIADDTYFNPWNDKFITDIFTKIKVEVIEDKYNKRKMFVDVNDKSSIKEQTKQKPIKKTITTEQKYKPLLKVFNEYNINKERIYKNKDKFLPVIKEYFHKNKIKYNNENFKKFLKLL